MNIQLGSSALPASDRKLHEWIRIGEWVLLALLVAYMGIRTLPRAWRTLNTDFPNYYLTARLVREHYDTSRIYEWVWLQRQKDHRDIEQRIVGMVPITPFSTLSLWPLARMPALEAKRWWLIFNLGLLCATIVLLHDLTQLPWRRILLFTALSFPLHVNFLLGQFYVLLLFLLMLSYWLYAQRRQFLAGVLIGLASGLKIFPVIYLIYFLRKRDLRAFAGGVIGAASTATISVLVFGWELNRTYLSQVLPATLRGEGLGPYNLKAASLSSLLHRLFIYEPQLNQHPAVNAAWLFAVLHPILQMAVIVPALLLATPEEACPRRLRLEWAAILLASLAVSTSPASYLFTLLILPVCFLAESLQQEKIHLAILLFLYIAAGFLGGINSGGEGWSALLMVPRFYALILLCVFTYTRLTKQQPLKSARRDRLAWVIALAVILTCNVIGNLRHQRGLYTDYQWRIHTPREVFMAVYPAIQDDSTLFVALLPDGYHSVVEHFGFARFSDTSQGDYLAVTATFNESWTEKTGHESTIVSTPKMQSDIRQAESPMVSFDGRWLAFLREDRGRARVWTLALDHPNNAAIPATPSELNVFEMSFLPTGEFIFAAALDGQPSLFMRDHLGNIKSLGIDKSRYPAISPDGHWLAYSQLKDGNWNLWLRDLENGQMRRLTHVACNNVEPIWTADSQSLIYASDCGRALWFTALCRQRIFR